MKQCPTCQSQYTDDTLRFCLQDGSPLQSVEAYGEQETVVSGRQSNQIQTPPVTNPTAWNPQKDLSNPDTQTAEKKSNAAFAVFVTAFIMLLLFAFVGIGFWIYYRGTTPEDDGSIFVAKKREDSDRTSNTSTAPDTVKATPTATVPPVTNSNANTTTNTAPVDREKIKQDVAQRVNSWKSALESRSLDNYMSHYAGTVDYYNQKGAKVTKVRADKQRAFDAYDSMKVNISNLSVTPDASGETATAVFDKEWVFEGAKYSAGKVQTQLKLKKVGGQWLITGERDLKIYYAG